MLNGGSTPEIGLQAAMHVDGAPVRSVPNDLGQHAEGDYGKEVGIPAVQGFQKGGILQFGRLYQGKVQRDGRLFDGRRRQFPAPSRWFVRRRDDTDHLMSAGMQCPKSGLRKIRGSEEHNAKGEGIRLEHARQM